MAKGKVIDFSKAKPKAKVVGSGLPVIGKMNDLYKLELHQFARDRNHRMEILRVVGGWIYMFSTGMIQFVPDPTRDTEH